MTSAMATTPEDQFPYVTAGKVTIADSYRDARLQDGTILNVTDYYFVYTQFNNHSQEPQFLRNVYYALMIVDQNGVATDVGFNTYGNRTVHGQGFHDFQLNWVPRAPGEYTIRSFLISGFEKPQILSDVATSQMTVKEKIVVLGEGESNYRLRVENINQTENSVHVIETYCVGSSYHREVEATLHVGEYVSIAAVDAYFLGIQDDGRAVFRFESNENEDDCLI